MLYWSPDLRLCYQNDTAVPLCDGATRRGQQSEACKQWNLYDDIKCKKSDMACWCKSEHGFYFSFIWLQFLASVIRWGLPYFRLQSPRVASHRLLEHIWHYRNTAEGEIINSLLCCKGFPSGHIASSLLCSGVRLTEEISHGIHGWLGEGVGGWS